MEIKIQRELRHIIENSNSQAPGVFYFKKPMAFGDAIKEASIKLSYAFQFDNEQQRQQVAEAWEDKLRNIIIKTHMII